MGNAFESIETGLSDAACRGHRYPVELHRSAGDAGYIVIVPALPGCSAWGSSEADAINEAHDAIAAWLKAAKSAGHAIPERNSQWAAS